MPADLTANEFATLTDYASIETDDGKRYENIINEHVKSLSLGQDIPVCIATGNMSDVGVYEEPWEYDKASSVYNLTSGRKFFKSGTYKREDIMGLRGGAIAIRKDLYDQKGETAKLWEARQIYKAVEFTGLDCEHDMFYGNPTANPDSSYGLQPRYSILTDLDGKVLSGDHAGELCTYITIDGSNGTATASQNGKLGSLYIMHLSSVDGVCWIYPKNSNYTGGVEFELGEKWQDVTETHDGILTAQKQKIHYFRRAGGVALKSRYACYRIANVDFSTDAGLQALEKSLYDVFDAIPKNFLNSVKVYIPQRAGSALKRYYNKRVQPNTYDESTPKNLRGDFKIDDMVFERCVQLGLTEDKVS